VITEQDPFGLSFIDENWCAEKYKSLRNEGIYTPPSLTGTLEVPLTAGGANWGGLSFDPVSQTMYLNTNRSIHVITLIPREDFKDLKAANKTSDIAAQSGSPYAIRSELLLSPIGIPCNAPPWGMLHATDLTNGTLLWESVLGTVRDVAPVPLPIKWGTPAFGAPIVTARCLVFIARTMDDYIRVFDKKTGENFGIGGYRQEAN
jgi:quinoprotein glucose dehydrogenase